MILNIRGFLRLIKKNNLLLSGIFLALMSFQSQAANKSYFGYANAIENTNIQRTFVDSMVKNYTRTVNTFEKLVTSFGHHSWAQSIVTQYEWYKSELEKYLEFQSLINQSKPTLVNTTYKYNFFPIITRNKEKEVSRSEAEVEEINGSKVNVYKEISIIYETEINTKNYKGIFTTNSYSDDTNETLVSTELLSTDITKETRTEVQKEFLRSYAQNDSISNEPALTPDVLTEAEYLQRDDVIYTGTDMYKQAVWNMNSRINEEYIDTKMQAHTNNLEVIGAPTAWSRGYTGLGSVIAILDTGIDLDHPEFEGKILDSKCFTAMCNDERLIARGDNETIDDKNKYSHGTHVAGIAAANFDGKGVTGVAPDSKLLIGKVAHDWGYYEFQSTGKAIEWAVNNGADVVNISASMNVDRIYSQSLVEFIPGQFYSTDTRGNYSTYGYNSLLANEVYHWPTVNAMQNNEAVVVVAAGNQRLKAAVYPAHLALNEEVGDRVVVAGAWDQASGTVISNKAGTICFDFNEETQSCNNTRLISDQYILAPGRHVASASDGGEYRTLSGSSMAAPAVSGAVAVIHQMWPHMKGENLAKLLLNTANKEIYNYDVHEHGQGLLDLAEATSPQGALGIPTTGRVDGATSSVDAISKMSISGAKISSISSLMAIDDYDRDFYFDGNALNSPSDTRTTHTTHAAANGYKADDYLGLNHGSAVPISNSIVKINTDNKDLSISQKMNDLTIGIVKESETFLGNYAKNALINIDGSATIYAGLNKEMKMNDTTFFGGVNFGLTKLNIDEAMMKSSDTMVSNSMNMGAKYKTDNHEIGLVAGLPIAITSGNASFNVPSNVSNDGDIEAKVLESSFASRSREINIGLFYNIDLSETSALNTFIENRVNYNGMKGKTHSEAGIEYSLIF